MKKMATLTFPDGSTYEIMDKVAREMIEGAAWRPIKTVTGVDIEALPVTDIAFTSGTKFVSGFATNAFVEGGKYLVTWGGTEYETRCYIEDDTLLVGNGALAGMTTETDHPFCIACFGGTGCFVYKSTTTAETITVKVEGIQEIEYNKLPKEFLPDDIGGKADWNVNDENASGYIANRTHYKDAHGNIVKLPEEYIPGGVADWTAGYASEGGYVYNRTHFLEDTGDHIDIIPLSSFSVTDYMLPITDDFTLIPGELYAVYYREKAIGKNKQFNSIASEINMEGMTLGVSVGDIDRGIQVVYLYEEYREMFGGLPGMVSTAIENGDITLYVKYCKTIIHKLPNKYLDLDWLPYIEKKEEMIAAPEDVTFDATGGVPWAACQTNNLVLEKNTNYKTLFDGTAYFNKAYSEISTNWGESTTAVYIGNGGLVDLSHSENAPFVFVSLYNGDTCLGSILYVESNSSTDVTHNIGIFKVTYLNENHKIPQVFLPEPVVFTTTDMQTVTCNKTYEECLYNYQNNILNAVLDGTPGKLPIMQYQYSSTTGSLMFYVFTDGGNYQITYSSNGVTIGEF